MATDQSFVFRVGTNPEPVSRVVGDFGQHAKIIVNAGAPNFADLFEMKRWMPWDFPARGDEPCAPVSALPEANRRTAS